MTFRSTCGPCASLTAPRPRLWNLTFRIVWRGLWSIQSFFLSLKYTLYQDTNTMYKIAWDWKLPTKNKVTTGDTLKSLAHTNVALSCAFICITSQMINQIKVEMATENSPKHLIVFHSCHWDFIVKAWPSCLYNLTVFLKRRIDYISFLFSNMSLWIWNWKICPGPALSSPIFTCSVVPRWHLRDNKLNCKRQLLSRTLHLSNKFYFYNDCGE